VCGDFKRQLKDITNEVALEAIIRAKETSKTVTYPVLSEFRSKILEVKAEQKKNTPTQTEVQEPTYFTCYLVVVDCEDGGNIRIGRLYELGFTPKRKYVKGDGALDVDFVKRALDIYADKLRSVYNNGRQFVQFEYFIGDENYWLARERAEAVKEKHKADSEIPS
jgi:hypothetical protein